jgi:hypothetical protein
MACTYLKILRKKFAISEKTSRKQNLAYHGNIKSLRNKINYITNLIEEFDIVFFTETHLNNQITDDDIAISGFDVPFRKDRNSHGGGIFMYHKSNINILRRVDLEHEHVESMWFELKTKVHPILININYRSELQSHTFYWQFFDLMLKQALDENSHIICLGDLNKNFMVNLPTTINDIVVVNALFNIIDKPTHFDKHTGNTLSQKIANKTYVIVALTYN